jgi:hypothetical protein
MPALQPNGQVNIGVGISKIILTGNNGSYHVVFHGTPPGDRSGFVPANGAQLVIKVNPGVSSTLYNVGPSPFTYTTQ